MPILFVFLAAVVTALLATPVAVRLMRARGVYGHLRPGGDAARERVPRLGGIPVIFATTAALGAAVLLPGTDDHLLMGMMAAGWLLFLAGLVDDLYDLRPLAKLAAQCAAAVVAYGFGFRVEEISFAGATADLGHLALPLTLLWIVGVTNAFNLIDGLDGLATGIAVVALGSTFVVSLMLGHPAVATVCAALGGALLGFLRYNFRPARIFLGDSGSLFVGFMLAVLSVHGSTKSATAVLIAVPLLVLALPLLDTSLAIVRRWLRGKPVFGADERHLHHRLLAIGVTHVRAVVLLYVFAAALAAAGMVLAFGPPLAVAASSIAAAGLILALLLFGIRRLGYHEFVEAGLVVRSGLRRVRQSIRDQIHARDVAEVLAAAESLEAVRAILRDNAEPLGLLAVTVCRESAADGGRGALPAGAAARAWKLECPVQPERTAESDPLVLRVWTEAPDDLRILTADRTARVLAAAVGAWLAGGRVPHVVSRVEAAPARPSTAAA